jgi:hypothetical protein
MIRRLRSKELAKDLVRVAAALVQPRLGDRYERLFREVFGSLSAPPLWSRSDDYYLPLMDFLLGEALGVAADFSGDKPDPVAIRLRYCWSFVWLYLREGEPNELMSERAREWVSRVDKQFGWSREASRDPEYFDL